MTVKHMIRNACVAFAAVATMTFFAGCESGGGGGDSGGGSVVGKWAMTGDWNSYWEFNSDGTFTMYDDANFTARHLGGTFSQDGSKVTGTFQNGRVGSGEIDATVNGETIELDFIEHWHSPYKHVPMTGTKI